jgi:hypothetical protein
MTDKELLEAAARAAGIELQGWDGGRAYVSNPYTRLWNPLTSDGDALRLAVKLGLAIRVLEKCVFVESDPETLLAFSNISELEMFGADRYAATRRAIVRAAAEIGKEIP